MPRTSSRWPTSTFLLRLLAAGLCGLLLVGCQGDEIDKHDRPRPPSRPLNRILGAVVPHADKLWFVKLVGPDETVKGQEEAFKQFLESIRFKEAAPAWELPKGWRQEAEAGELRFALIDVGHKDLEMSVSETPRGKDAAFLWKNVNRWRNMLALPTLPDDVTEALTQKTSVDGHPAVLVDFVGPGTGKRAIQAPHAPQAPVAPPGKGRSKLKYKVPDGWTQKEAKGFRVAAFDVTEKSERAEVTVIPLAGQAGSLLDNINRWRNELKLPPVDKDQVTDDLQILEVAGIKCPYVDMVGPAMAAGGRQRTLAVSVPHGGQVWFFKMMGSAELVGREKPTFEVFVTSARFLEGAKK